MDRKLQLYSSPYSNDGGRLSPLPPVMLHRPAQARPDQLALTPSVQDEDRAAVMTAASAAKCCAACHRLANFPERDQPGRRVSPPGPVTTRDSLLSSVLGRQ